MKDLDGHTGPGGYIEPLLLFLVIFYAPSRIPPDAEIQRSLLFRVPAFFLVLLCAERGSGERPLRFRRADLAAFAASYPALLLVSLLVSLAAAVFAGGLPAPPSFPSGGWAAAIAASFSAGYLEESYFRAYLIPRFRNPAAGLLFSVILFGLCHFYEGPWGVVNALAAGLVLSVIFTRLRTLHGIALAHSLYNITAYALALRENG